MNALDSVIIKDLRIKGFVGIHDWEQRKKQEILINCEIFTDLEASAQSDRIQDTIDYHKTVKAITEHVESEKRYTVEKLAQAVMQIVLSHPLSHSALVTIEKPNAVSGAKSVGVKIFKEKIK